MKHILIRRPPSYSFISTLVGFGRACAPVRCAHPSFGTHCHAKQALRAPPAHRSFAASYLPPKAYPQAQTLAARGVYLSIGLSCTLLSYIAELRCTLLSSAAP
jgi:hypothetical protein